MGFLRKQGSRSAEVTQYMGLQIQSSSPAIPITIAYGINKLAGNLLWYGNFRAIPEYTKTRGKGGSRTLSGYSYSTAFVMGLCEGPITSVGRVWRDQGVFYPSYIGLSTLIGSASQEKSTVVQNVNSAQALAYRGTACVESHNFALGSSATLGNMEFEVYGLKYMTAYVNTYDADPAEVIYDFLTNAQYGIGFPAASIDAGTLFASVRSGTITISIAAPAVVNWSSHGFTNGEAVYFSTTGALPTGLVAGAVYYVANATISTFELAPTIGGGSLDVFGTQSGIHKGYAAGGSYQDYCWSVGIGISPVLSNREPANAILSRWLQLTNSTAVWSAGRLKFIPYGDVADSGSWADGTLVTFVPKVSPIYDLCDDDYVGGSEEDPVLIERKDPYSIYNVFEVEFSDRTYGYNTSKISVWDQNAIESFGRRDGATINAHEICDKSIAQKVGQMILQRNLYIRDIYTFKLSFEYCLLEPMDVVTLTDSRLGLDKTPVRIISIEEDDDGVLNVVAEEFPGSTGSVAVYPVQGNEGILVDHNIAPSSVNRPVIFEPPFALAGGERQLWLAVSGGLAPTHRLEENSTLGTHLVSAVVDDLFDDIMEIGTVVSFRAHVKAGERTACRLGIHDGVQVRYASFDLESGGSSPDSATTSVSIVAVGSWYLVTMSCAMAAPVNPVVSIALEVSVGSSSYAGSGGEGLFVWSPQCSVSGGSYSSISASMTAAGATFDPDSHEPPVAAGTADANWGGCFIHVSTDNATYTEVGQVNGAARQGVTTTSFGRSDDLLSVSLSESGGTLDRATAWGAANGVTLCLVGDELVAYAGAMLAASHSYDLSGVVRGLYGSVVPTLHPIGVRFARLDNAIFKYTIPASYVGETLYLKFQSFNIFGVGVQDLATCVTYMHTPTGIGSSRGPVIEQLALGFDVDLGLIGEISSADDDLVGLLSPTSGTVDLGGIS
jgi:hypothetical protein